MPRYIVTNRSQFQPFSYSELVAPVQQMTEMHNAAMDNYDQLDMETSALGQYITDDDPKSKKIYDTYLNQLRSMRESLSERGFTPQTRRDLAAARGMFAKDITALKAAITNRAARSKEYWDMKRAHPDMVMGTDPGMAGLDNYLGDDNYGRDYYAYSGDSFMKEVGTDAQARASELIRQFKDRYGNAREIPGYITHIEQQGFTSGEVQRATELARAALEAGQRDLDESTAEGILANVLLSHLDSTGAIGQLDPDELERLFNYGASGLSQAIGKTTTQFLSDKVYDYNQQLRLAREKARLKGRSGANPTQTGYDLRRLLVRRKSPDFEKFSASVHDRFELPYSKQPLVLRQADGTMQPYNSLEDASYYVYSGNIRDTYRQELGGLDVGMTGSDDKEMRQSGILTAQDGNTYEIRTGKMTPAIAQRLGIPYDKNGSVVEYQKPNGGWEVHGDLTRRFNEGHSEYVQRTNAIKQNNLNTNYKYYTMDPDEEFKWKKDNNLDQNIPMGIMRQVAYAKHPFGEQTPSPYLTYEPRMDGFRETLEEAIWSEYDQARTMDGGKMSNTTPYAFYKVKRGGIDYEDKATKMDSVFEMDKDGRIHKGSLRTVNLFPEDLILNGGETPMVRIQARKAGNKDGGWAVDARMLGPEFYNTLMSPRQVGREVYTLPEMVEIMMTPIDRPEEIITGFDDATSQAWANFTANVLGTVPVMPQEFIMDKNAQGNLYDAICNYITAAMSVPRDDTMQNGMQATSTTSTKASPYLNLNPTVETEEDEEE